jgi:hypothetical protein
MSTVTYYKCDCCKEVYGTRTTRSIGGRQVVFDLCPECQKSFNKVWAERKAPEEPKKTNKCKPSRECL